MNQFSTGLDNLLQDPSLQEKIKGNIAYLCHSASVDKDLSLGVLGLKKIFKKRLKKLFGPQHGLVSDVQDNMVETDHFTHKYFDLPVYSLYSETRIPTASMLEGIDIFIIDLQDVGTRVYTYIATMTACLIQCAELGIQVVILDRPNPAGGHIIEGNILEADFSSFVGPLKIPQRHAMTMAEVAKYAMIEKELEGKLDLLIIPMKNWKRDDFFKELNRPWINPSPNLSTSDSALTFVGTVLFEGTNISEGRGTTRALEYIGHPQISHYELLEKLNIIFQKEKLTGFKLRPISFFPTFQKHSQQSCQGYQIHVTSPSDFQSWSVSQILCREFYHHLGSSFQWNSKAYEYEHEKLSIDLINGTDKVRKWVESNGSYQELKSIEMHGREKFMAMRNQLLIY